MLENEKDSISKKEKDNIKQSVIDEFNTDSSFIMSF
jgi:hypothetical protein